MTTGITVTDWNNARQNGWYQGNGAANAPTADWWIGEVIAHRDYSPAYITQRVMHFTDGYGLEYRRNCLNDVWTGWWLSGKVNPTYADLKASL
jgi:hypothetical protein